jgi:hypothetical protein
MSELDFAIEPEVECPNDDSNDDAFVRGTTTIGGRDAVNEYVACRMYPLAAGFSFKSVPVGTTIMSKVDFLTVVRCGDYCCGARRSFLAKVEMNARRVLGSFEPREYNALAMANILNIGHLNRVFNRWWFSMLPALLLALKPLKRLIRKGRMRCQKTGC